MVYALSLQHELSIKATQTRVTEDVAARRMRNMEARAKTFHMNVVE